MPRLVFLYAAEASTYSTGHAVLQRNLASDLFRMGKFSHRHHHRFRTAGVDLVEIQLIQNRMIRYIALLAIRTIFCGRIDSTDPLEIS